MQKDLLRWNSVRRKAETLWDPKMGYVIYLFVVVEAVVMPLRAVYCHLLFPFGCNEGVIALKKAKKGGIKWHSSLERMKNGTKQPIYSVNTSLPARTFKDQQHKGQRAFYER